MIKCLVRLLLVAGIQLADARPAFSVSTQASSFHKPSSYRLAFLRLRGGSDDPYYDDYSRRNNQYQYNDYQQDHDDRDSYYNDYDDRGRSKNVRYSSSSDSPLNDVTSLVKHGNKKVGLSLLAGGTVLSLVGMSLFFHKGLMRMGNLLFIAGVPMTIGPGRTAGYFFQPKKSRATACLAVGIFLVFVGHPIFGIALEIFGLLNLFGNMFPVLLAVLKQMPFVGPLIPAKSGSQRRATNRYNTDDRYPDDDDDEDSPYYGDSGNGRYYSDDRQYYERDRDDRASAYY